MIEKVLHILIIPLLISIALLLSSCQKDQERVTVARLQCEYLENPLGIDCENPRFTWQLRGEEKGIRQQACKLFVGTDSVDVSNGTGNKWESGTIHSETIPAIYDGPALDALTRYYWAVKIKDEKGHWTVLSDVSRFETGMMGQDKWKGDWITDTHDYHVKPAALFRKSFQVQRQPESARLYIAAGGLYELSLNGEKVGDHVLDPMFTRYDRRNLYVTYDITEEITEGENILAVHLGNGWYNHHPNTAWYFDKAPWRARPKFCLDLRIKYADGTEEVISTDRSWKTSSGPVVSNNIYTGEHYDARLCREAWDKTGFDDTEWENALPTGVPSQQVFSQSLHPIRDVEVLPARAMEKLDERTYVFDFGRNISGTSKISLSGPEGTRVELIHAERLDAKGHADVSHISQLYFPEDGSDPIQTDVVYLSGKEDCFRSRFTYKGFQYVEVSADKPLSLRPESVEAVVQHSDLPVAGSIHTSSELINKIWKAGNASYLANMFGYPTDCPTREKNGWTGDAHIAVETGLFNFDGITVYEKWMADHRDEQQPNGVLPAIIPTSGWGYQYQWGNGPDWTSTIVLIPWNIYLFYGDTRILEECYGNMISFVDHLEEVAPDGIIRNWGLGDWASEWERPPVEFVASTYYYIDALILSRIARILNKEGDYQKYAELAQGVKKAINDLYLDRETGVYGKGLQTELAMPLYWGLVPDDLRGKLAENLANQLLADNRHIKTGIMGAKAVLGALSENGYADLAYEIVDTRTYPSWGYLIENGATTFYESWSLDGSSLNHIMYGQVSAWFYKALGGINPDEANPGFKNIILKPNFVKGLEHFEARHLSPYGEIVSSWKRENDAIEYRITIPPNSSADLRFSNKKVEIQEKDQFSKIENQKEINGDQMAYRLGSGIYRFRILDL